MHFTHLMNINCLLWLNSAECTFLGSIRMQGQTWCRHIKWPRQRDDLVCSVRQSPRDRGGQTVRALNPGQGWNVFSVCIMCSRHLFDPNGSVIRLTTGHFRSSLLLFVYVCVVCLWCVCMWGLGLIYRSFLYTPDQSSLLDLCITNTFSKIVICLFTLWIVHFMNRGS